MLIASSINANLWSRSLSFITRSRSIDLLFEVGWSTSIFRALALMGIFFLPLWHFDWWSPIIRDPWSLRLLLLLWHHPGPYCRRLICTPPIPFIVLGNFFWALFVCLLIGVSCLNTCWKVLCTILMQFVPLLLGESLLQYHWNILCAVRTLFIPYCLGNSLIQYCWKVLCAIYTLFIPYHFGEFPAPTLF